MRYLIIGFGIAILLSGYQTAYSADIQSVTSPTPGDSNEGRATVFGSPRMSQGHPCILMDNEDIARYREQLTRNSDLKSEFARLQKWGDQRIQQPLGVPKHETNSEGQWIYPEYKAGYKDASGKYQWEWKFNAKLQRLANDVYDLGVLCAFTGSEKYADYAKNILLALVDVYGHEKGNPPVDPQWKNHFEPFGFDGGDTALFLVKTCNGYDQIYNFAKFTAEERRQVEDNLIRPLAYHLKSQNYMFTSLQNWGMMCLYGVFAAGMTLEDSTLTNAALYGLNGTQGKPTGGIFGYWFNPATADQDKNWDKSDTKSQLFSLSIMASVAEICWHHGIDLYSYHDAAMKKIFDYPLAFSSTESSTSESLEIKYREFSRLQGVTAYDYAFLRYRAPLYLPVIERMDKTLSMGGNCEIPCLFLAGASMTGRPSPEPIASRVAATPPHNDITTAVRASDEMLVNGNFADGNAHWVVEESGATGRAEYVKEGPDGKVALRLRVLTIGDNTWRLQIYQTGMRVEKGKTYVMTFWARSDRDVNVTVNCMQNHEPWDHHTQEKMSVSTEWKQMKFAFIAPWDDNNVRISFTDLATVPGQVYWFADCSLVPGPKVKTDETLTSKAFVWKGDCSSEAAFVNSNHQIIPGHYEYLPDANEPKRGHVFTGHLTPDFTTTDPEKFHMHPEIYFDRFIPGSITVSFDVKVDDLAPSELGPYGENPWLNVVTLFDETTRAGGTTFHPSVMVNLVGAPGQYRLQAYSISPAGAGTFFDKLKDTPVFPTGKWVTVRVEADVKTKQVRVYQDNMLASAGPYSGKPGLAGAHMGLYANRKMTRATVFNDDITITVGD